MNILHVTPCYLPAYRYGGPIKSTHELCAKLVQSGIDVTVYTTNADGAGTLDVPPGEEVRIDGVKVFYFPVQKPGSYFRSSQFSKALKHDVRQFDLVHIHWLYVYTTMAAARECKRHKVPYVISPRGMLDPYAIERKSKLKKKLYISLIEKKNLEDAGGIHFTTMEEQRLAETLGISFKGFVVPNGLDITEYPACNGSNGGQEHNTNETILFLGRVDPKKGLDLLVDAFAVIARERPKARLVIAGPDDSGHMEKLQPLISHYGLDGKVMYRGMLEGEGKVDAFREASVFVLPSYSENFGMAVAEAMAFCKPVVISDRVNICHDVADYKAGVVTSCSSHEIAEAVIKILQRPQSGREMGMNGRKLVEERFNLDTTSGKMIIVYKNILNNKLNFRQW